MAKSSACCLGGVMLVASLVLNVALITGCVSFDGNPPYIHIGTSSQSEVEALKKEIETLKKERVASLERLRAIAKEIGMDATGGINDEVVLKGEIIQRLLDGKETLPRGVITEDDIGRIEKQLTNNNIAVQDACKFVMKLKGKKVIVIESEEK